jgi:hypothetical protein
LYGGRVLDRRVYRVAFVPALLAVFVMAFSLANRPAPARAPMGGELFDVDRAFGTDREPPLASLVGLAREFPSRRPGSAGDAGLAQQVALVLGRQRFEVARGTREERTVDGRRELETVAGVRPGTINDRIAVLASRDSLDEPGLADLSATAALLEIARLARTRDLRHTLELVSVSGGTAGSAGARSWAREAADRGDVTAVLVLGDLAGEYARRPWVVPWSSEGAPAPLALRRTVETAVRAEAGAEPGETRAASQWVRRALPVTLGDQGPLLAAGLDAVRLSVSGERPPPAGVDVSPGRLAGLGASALRTISALDTAAGPGSFESNQGIVTMRRVLPDWAVRLFVASLLLPALLAAFDAYFRVRRRGLPAERWLLWAAAAILPLLGVWILARLLGLAGLVAAPPGASPAGALEHGVGHWVALVLLGLLALGTLVAAQPVASRLLGLRERPRSTGGPAAAAALVVTLTATAAWVVNPYLAALLVPAAHAWLFAAAPELRWRALPSAMLVVAGLLVPIIAVWHLGRVLSMDLLDLVWLGVLGVAGGQVAPGLAMLLGALSGALVATLVAVRARLVMSRRPGGTGAARGGETPSPGPLTYAGPGSLGGTESALPR